LLRKRAWLLEERGDFEQALELIDRAQEIFLSHKSGGWHDYLLALHQRAKLCSRLERFEEAEDLFHEVIHERRQLSGDRDLHLQVAINDLGSSYHSQKRFRESVIEHRRALGIQREVLGEEHPSTLNSMHNLATSQSALGQLKEAVELLEKVLDARRRILGPDHPRTLFTMANLPGIYSSLSRFEKAEDTYLKVIEGFRRVRGPDHPETSIVMNNLAVFYTNRGRLEEAESWYQETLELREEIYPEGHPQILRLRDGLLWVYRKSSDHERTEELARETIEVFRPEEKAPDVSYWSVRNHLGHSLESQDRLEEAEEVFRKSCLGTVQFHGPDHAESAKARKKLTDFYVAARRQDPDGPWEQRAQQFEAEVFGGYKEP
jgi:tetratricopeptide (TPR) repeat protein